MIRLIPNNDLKFPGLAFKEFGLDQFKLFFASKMRFFLNFANFSPHEDKVLSFEKFQIS